MDTPTPHDAGDPPVVMSLDLTGRRVLVTGGGQGVGRGIALGFAAAGAEVVVNDLDPAASRRRWSRRSRRRAAPASASVFDVTDFARRRGRRSTRSGPVDVLVNNAGNAGAEGFGGRGVFAETEPADWEPFLRVNLYGAMHCCRAVLPGMIAARLGPAHHHRLRRRPHRRRRRRRLQRLEGRRRRAHPGARPRERPPRDHRQQHLPRHHAHPGDRTDLGRSRQATWPRAMLAAYVVRRPGGPDDVASLAVYLASDHASWITGQTYPLNGGYSFAL